MRKSSIHVYVTTEPLVLFVGVDPVTQYTRISDAGVLETYWLTPTFTSGQLNFFDNGLDPARSDSRAD